MSWCSKTRGAQRSRGPELRPKQNSFDLPPPETNLEKNQNWPPGSNDERGTSYHQRAKTHHKIILKKLFNSHDVGKNFLPLILCSFSL